jgi:ketosteroid isomerase-like protein
MATASAEVVREQFRAFERGVDAAARFWHPDIEWRAVEGAADDVGPIKGQDALRRYYQDWIDTLDDLRAEVEEILFEGDGRVAAVVRNAGVGRASGVAVKGRYYVVCAVADGRIVAGREYATRDEALDAVSPPPTRT